VVYKKEKAMDFLRDAAWQFVGMILALLGIFVSILVYLKQRQVKGIAYEVISDTSVLSIQEEVKGKIQVLYNGTPVEEAHLVVLRIRNFGTASGSPADYILPLTFDFGENAEILDTEILETVPNDLKKEIALDKSSHEVMMKPILLNSQDSIKLKVLVTRIDQINVGARINGMPRIYKSEELPRAKRSRAIKRALWISFFCIVGSGGNYICDRRQYLEPCLRRASGRSYIPTSHPRRSSSRLLAISFYGALDHRVLDGIPHVVRYHIFFDYSSWSCFFPIYTKAINKVKMCGLIEVTDGNRAWRPQNQSLHKVGAFKLANIRAGERRFCAQHSASLDSPTT
jgi:hypothetical protein